MGEIAEHTSDLIIGAYFFAMRACEFCWTTGNRKTQRLTMNNITFRGRSRNRINQEDPALAELAHYVTICFVDQKNGTKMDRRSQGRTENPSFCPVRTWAQICSRLMRHFPQTYHNIEVCSLRDHKTGETVQITSSQVSHTLKSVCERKGGHATFGIEPKRLGSRSIRSGAAMALFLANQPTERIKILGRWSSDAFLAYIRPQVLEWTNTMARDMAKTKDFLDLNQSQEIPPSAKIQARGKTRHHLRRN